MRKFLNDITLLEASLALFFFLSCQSNTLDISQLAAKKAGSNDPIADLIPETKSDPWFVEWKINIVLSEDGWIKVFGIEGAAQGILPGDRIWIENATRLESDCGYGQDNYRSVNYPCTAEFELNTDGSFNLDLSQTVWGRAADEIHITVIRDGKILQASVKRKIAYIYSQYPQVNTLAKVREPERFLLQPDRNYIWAGTTQGLYLCPTALINRLDECLHWTRPHGLPDNDVTLLLEINGTLWIATYTGGVVRFGFDQNGSYTFVPYPQDSGLATLHISRLLETHDGSIWIGTKNGLYRYSNGASTHYTSSGTNGTLAGNIITALVESGDPTNPANWLLWIGTNLGLSRFHLADNIFEKSSAAGSVQVNAVFQDPTETVWLGTNNGFKRYDDSATLLSSTPITDFQTTASATGPATLWIAANNTANSTGGFYQHSIGSASTSAVPGVSNGKAVTQLIKSGDGSFWIGSVDGLYHVTVSTTGSIENKIRYDSTISGFPNNHITALLETSDATLWVGTEHGLAKWMPIPEPYGSFHNFSQNGLIDNTITTFAEDAKTGQFSIGTQAGLTHLTAAETFINETLLNGIEVTAVVWAQDGSIWVGSNTGLYHPSSRSTPYTTADGLPNNHITRLFEDSYGTLWIGTETGIAQMRNGNIAKRPESVRITHIFEFDNALWVGWNLPMASYGGISRVDRDTNGLFSIGSPIHTFSTKQPAMITEIVKGKNPQSNNLWIGTTNGLYEYHPNATQLTKIIHNLLPSSMNVTQIVARVQSLWVGTVTSGLYLLSLSPDTTVVETVIHYTTKDYVKKSESGYDCIYKMLETQDGSIWINAANNLYPIGDVGTLIQFKDGQFNTHDILPGDFALTMFERVSNGQDNLWIGTSNGIVIITP